MERFSLPFEIPMYGDCLRVRGMIRASAEQFFLEYQTCDALIGAFNGELQTREIAWADLEGVESGNGFFSPWLLVKAKSMKAIEKLPSEAPGRVRFGIPWKCRRELRAMASEINLMLSFHEADRLLKRLPGGGA